MSKPKIPKWEFEERIARIREAMQRENLDAVLVYGDEYRKEQLRYVANYWPIFDRGALLIGRQGEPVLLAAPESQKVAEEMSPWKDVRSAPELFASYISDEIDYPLAHYYRFSRIAEELREKGELRRLGVVGVDAMCVKLYEQIKEGFGCEIVDADRILYEMREVKSENERACLREAGRIAQSGIQALLEANIIGLTEKQAAGIAEAAARKEGAESIVFTICATGARSNNIVPRATEKVIEDGDMISFGLAVMYEGYVATCQVPFAVGNYSAQAWRIIDALVRAADIGLKELRAGNPMKNIVTAVRDYFRSEHLDQYDVYPPLHGVGLAEAENPYPDEHTERVFEPGMTFNTDISLFGAPGDSTRIEGGYLVTEQGYDPITPFVDEYCKKWIAEREQSPFCEK